MNLRRLLLPSALIVAGLLTVANAQNITKAIQLSQDSSGAFGVDSSNNVYFPAHVLNTAVAGIPTVAAAAGTAPTIATFSSDFVGQITGGAASTTTATITFKAAYLSAPFCLVVQSGGSASTLTYTTATTGINITSILGTGIMNYLCSGAK